jgi:glycosyltransferase involved in cell wall biosynthesis
VKLLFVNARYDPEGIGGPARSLRIWAERMAADGHRALVVCRSAAPQRMREERKGVEVLRLPLALTDVQAARTVAELIAALAPDVVHSHFLKGFDKDVLAQALAPFPGRSVHTLHEYSLLCREGLLFRNGRMCRSICDGCRDVAGRARPFTDAVDAVAGVSRHVLDRHLEEGLFTHTAARAVIPNSYDAPLATHPGASAPSALRLGYLGRLSQEKGLDHLLETVAGMPSGTAVDLLVAGRIDTPYAQGLRERFDSRRIRFLGYADPERFLPAIDVLVFPSLCEETFGRGVIEAHAHGVPVIVSDRGALPELVTPGKTGWRYSPAEPDALRTRILSVLRGREELRSMAPLCREAVRPFTTDRVVGAYYALYSGAPGETP